MLSPPAVSSAATPAISQNRGPLKPGEGMLSIGSGLGVRGVGEGDAGAEFGGTDALEAGCETAPDGVGDGCA
jgi:hypothetical protein